MNIDLFIDAQDYKDSDIDLRVPIQILLVCRHESCNASSTRILRADVLRSSWAIDEAADRPCQVMGYFLFFNLARNGRV